jgi:outer membrane protein OmpA-like peptidoglycan-associated protein/opacity protein-like surface antigen
MIIIIFLLITSTYAQQSPGRVNIGLNISAIKLVGGNKDNSMISLWETLSFAYLFTNKIGIELNGGVGTNRDFDTNKDSPGKYFVRNPDTPYRIFLYPLIANLRYNLIPQRKINPYLCTGLGLLFWDLRNVTGSKKRFLGGRYGTSIHGLESNILWNIGAGIEWCITDNWGIDLSLRFQKLFAQDLDMSGFGDVNSGNIEARCGIGYCLIGCRDIDRDGIEDKADQCINRPEDMDGFEDEDGCPDLDNDKDGIPDLRDKAPNHPEDMDGFEDEDGVPDLDNDKDGIPDDKDMAPDAAEDMDGYKDEDGLPDLDNDGDGIPDDEDQCINEPENINGFEDEDGCPDKKPEIIITKDSPVVLEGVSFASGSAGLTENAKKLLLKVLNTLKDYPDMVVEVRGHTDNIGKRNTNIKLSGRRANSVKNYLVQQGINANRIVARGFGFDDPIASNLTREGREKNRRIEFIRLK